MFKTTVKVITTGVSLVLGLLGTAFLAGTVAGAIIATDADVKFVVGDKTILGDKEETTEETEE